MFNLEFFRHVYISITFQNFTARVDLCSLQFSLIVTTLKPWQALQTTLVQAMLGQQQCRVTFTFKCALSHVRFEHISCYPVLLLQMIRFQNLTKVFLNAGIMLEKSLWHVKPDYTST